MGCGASNNKEEEKPTDKNNTTTGQPQVTPGNTILQASFTVTTTNGKKYPTLVGGESLTFGLNGSLIEIPSGHVDPTVKLAHYLREQASLKGTKVGCGEGGCGACAVLLSRYDPQIKKVVTTSANACLRPMVTLHGYHVTTVEGIGGPNHAGGFHAIQKRFAELNASQCGFCTPGFVVSVYSQMAKKSDSTMADIENAMDGNLCRCTGYRPIMDAGKSFAKDSNVKDDIGNTVIPNDQLQVSAEIDAMFPASLKKEGIVGTEYIGSGVSYYRAQTLEEVRNYIESHSSKAKLVCAQTASGVYKDLIPSATEVCDVSYIPELRSVTVHPTHLEVGSVTAVSTFLGELLKVGETKGGSTKQTFTSVAHILQKIGNVHLRDVGSIGGNVSMCKEQGFASDLVTPLSAIGATVNVIEMDPANPGKGTVTPMCYSMLDWVQLPTPAGMTSLIVSISIPFPPDSTFTGCYRTAIRCTNAHAITNSCFHAHLNGDKVVRISAVYGVVGEISIPGKSGPKKNEAVNAAAAGKSLKDANLIATFCDGFSTGDFVTGAYKLTHRQRLVKAFYVQFIQEVAAHVNSTAPPTPMLSTQVVHPHTVHKSTQKLVVDSGTAVGKPIPRPDGVNHASGSAEYVSDLKEPKDCLFAAWVISRIAKGQIKHIPKEVARDMPGVERVLVATDLPAWCKNNVPSSAPMVPFPGEYAGQPIFSAGEIVHHSQPVGLVLADTQQHAVAAAKALTGAIEYSEQKPIVTIDQAVSAKVKPSFVRPCSKGNIWSKLKESKGLTTLKTTVEMESQKHFYMETHSVYAHCDDRKVQVWVGNQFPMYVHKAVAANVGLPFSQVEVRNYRIGGSFGGKLPAIHACATAVASKIMGRPVKLHLDRNVDSQMQGGREETRADLEVSYTSEGKIEAIQYDVYKAPGYFPDSAALPLFLAMPHALFLPYKVHNHSGTMHCLPTNVAPRSWCRGPGEIESAFIQEEVIDRVAFALGKHSQEIREINMVRGPSDMDHGSDNLLSANTQKKLLDVEVMGKLTKLMGDDVPKADLKAALKDPEMGPVVRDLFKANILSSFRDAFGDLKDLILGTNDDATNPDCYPEETNFTLDDMYDKLMEQKGWRDRLEKSKEFNAANKLHKKGVAITPLVYHMFVVPATAMVNIYPDGSVLVHHGGIEMGQGLIIKVLQAANQELSRLMVNSNLDMALFHSAGNNTSTLPLQSWTGGSTASESNVLAVEHCCRILCERLNPVVGNMPLSERTWEKVVTEALSREINLCAQHNTVKNDRFEYDAYCLGATQIDLDVLTGEVLVERFDIQYDSGKSMNPAVDVGQIEGAVMMGLGYMLQEDTHLNKETGMEEAHGTWEYKPPFAINVPREFNIELHHNPNFRKGIMSSKACGEPPLCVTPAISSAVHQAVQSARKDNGLEGFAEMSVPFTPWKVADACGGSSHMKLHK